MHRTRNGQAAMVVMSPERYDFLAHSAERGRIWREASDPGDPRQLLRHVLLTSDPGADRIRIWTRDIGRRFLLESSYAREPDFARLHIDDLSFLFVAYDTRFLNGLCGQLLGPEGVTFRLSSRMTRAAGKTTCFRRLDGTTRFEMAVATSILFDGFLADDPEVTVCGLPCGNRLEALQRLFEHELVHLADRGRPREVPLPGSVATRARQPDHEARHGAG